MFLVEVEAGAGDLGRDQGIDDDETPFTLDQGHVRDVEAAHLEDAVRHAEQAVAQIEPRLTPETRIDGGRRFRVGEEGVVAERPHDAPLIVLDLDLGQGGEKATTSFVEVLRVGERQRVQHRVIQCGRDRRGVLGAGNRRGHRGDGIAGRARAPIWQNQARG